MWYRKRFLYHVVKPLMRSTYISTLQTKPSLGACRKCLCWLPGLSGSPTSSCRWPIKQQRSTLVATCLSLLSAHTPGQHCSNRRATLRMHGRVWLQTPYPVNAQNAEADAKHDEIWRADNGDVSIEAEVGRKRHTLQTEVVASCYGVEPSCNTGRQQPCWERLSRSDP